MKIKNPAAGRPLLALAFAASILFAFALAPSEARAANLAPNPDFTLACGPMGDLLCNWSVGSMGASVTRDMASFHSSPASMLIAHSGWEGVLGSAGSDCRPITAAGAYDGSVWYRNGERERRLDHLRRQLVDERDV